MKNTKFRAGLMAVLAGSILISGCGSRMAKGAGIGAGVGGFFGALIGRQYDETGKGAIIGATVGGTVGAVIGRNMDKQAEELKQVEGAKVERVGEGIQVTMDSGILFQINEHSLQAEARENIRKIAEVLNRYPDTDIIVAGHTSSDGPASFNQTLSERRAESVANYLKTLDVSEARIKTAGFGPSQPVMSNETPEGRQANRRVEIAIMANEKMKEDAAAGKLQ